MRITLAVVMSLDAKITRHDEKNVKAWASVEDQAFFSTLVADHDCIVVGRGTYEATMKNLQNDDGRLRIVLTTNPRQYATKALPGRLEFLNKIPQKLVQDIEARGLTSVLVAGGPSILMQFLLQKLGDTLYTTIEPVLFGSGTPLLPPDTQLMQQLHLESYSKLNEQGTLLLKYSIVQNEINLNTVQARSK